MKRLSPRLQISPLMRALLSLGIAPVQSSRAVVKSRYPNPSQGPHQHVAGWLIRYGADQRNASTRVSRQHP